MAAEEPYTLLLSLAASPGELRRGASEQDVHVALASAHNRASHTLDALIEDRWAAAVARNPRTFDGSKFRMARITWADGQSAIKLDLGLTSYKEYLGTNRLDEPDFLKLGRDGQDALGDAAAHLSNALGCEALLLTVDKQVVLLRRSTAVGTHEGLYNGPSGHPEPGSAGLPKDGSAALAAVLAGEAAAEASQRVRQELFASVLDEICAETNVPRDSLSAPRLIGCMADSRGKPDLLFFVQTSLDGAAVRDCYARGAEEGWESDRLALVAIAEMKQCRLQKTPVTRAAIECFFAAIVDNGGV